MAFSKAVYDDVLGFDVPMKQGRGQSMHKMKNLCQFDQILQGRRFGEARAFIVRLTEFLQTFSFYIRTDIKTGFPIPLQENGPGKRGCKGRIGLMNHLQDHFFLEKGFGQKRIAGSLEEDGLSAASDSDETGRSLLRIFQTGNELVMFCERVRQDEIFHRQFLRIQSLDSR